LRSHPTTASIEVITMPAGTSASYSAISSSQFFLVAGPWSHSVPAINPSHQSQSRP
jgi:hypothetical protein